VQLRIGRAGEERPVGEVGEVCVRSSAVMSEYWHDPDATAAALVDGWLHTGDLGYIDDRGDLHLAGRTTEMYIRGGYNVYPQEVEAVLSQHPSVDAVAVVPRPDDVMGEIGVAVVVSRSRDAELSALRIFAADQLAGFKLPEVLRFVDELPLTQTQKLDRRHLTALVARPAPDEQRVRG
jgi:acyl-CoA synthetase (AMP-forming)/AMP-acid ligase II